MPIAEDVAAFAAVMASSEVAEVAFTGGIIADGGFGVRLLKKTMSAMA